MALVLNNAIKLSEPCVNNGILEQGGVQVLTLLQTRVLAPILLFPSTERHENLT